MARYNHMPPGEAEILFYGSIASDDLTAKDIAQQLQALAPLRILHLRIHSGGGSTGEASAIISQLNRLRASGVRIVSHIDGGALSAAAWIVAAVSDQVLIAEDAMVMIHDAAVQATGKADYLRQAAVVLDKVSKEMARDIARHLKRREDEVSALLLRETWWNASEAVANGFAHGIEEPLKLAAAFTPAVTDRSIGAMAKRYWARQGARP